MPRGRQLVGLLLLVLQCADLAGATTASVAAAATAAPPSHQSTHISSSSSSPTTTTTTTSSSSSSSKSIQEAGQFFGINFSLGGQQPASDAAAGSGSQLTTGATFLPGLLGVIPGAIASVAGAVLGLQPAGQQQQQQQQAAPKQPKQPHKQQSAAKQQPHKAAPKKWVPKQPDTKQQQQQQPGKTPGPKQLGRPAPPSTSSLIANGPPWSQQQQQQQQKHKVYYKRQQPKAKLPVVAATPSYVPHTKPGTVPMCEWRSDFNNCQVHRHHYLALKEQPTSYIAQTIVASSARDYACSAHTEAASCQESSQGLRCGWNLSGGRTWDSSGCRSYYMAEWTVFSYLINAGVGPATAATGLTNLGAFSCPRSLAARALACNTAYPMDHSGNYNPNMCASAAPGCTFQHTSNSCILSQQLTSQLAKLKPADIGTCSASCYLRALDACPAKPNRGPAGLTDPARCWARPGCSWAGGACGPDLYSSQLDAWGRKVAAAAAACGREREAWGCGQAGAKGLLWLSGAAAQAALQRAMPGPGQQDAKCPL